MPRRILTFARITDTQSWRANVTTSGPTNEQSTERSAEQTSGRSSDQEEDGRMRKELRF